MGCYVKEYPENCFNEGGCISHILAWIFGGLPMLFTFVSLPVINLIIYRFVRNQLLAPQADGTTRTTYQIEQVREVASQGILYVFSFYLAYFPAFVVKAAEAFGVTRDVEEDWYWLMLLNAMLPPLQGLFNALVYLRPNWKRLKRAYPGETTLWYIQELFLDLTVPTLASTIPSNRSKTNKSNRSKKGSDFSSNLNVIPEQSQEDRSDGSYDSTSDNSFAHIDVVKHEAISTRISTTGPFSDNDSNFKDSVSCWATEGGRERQSNTTIHST